MEKIASGLRVVNMNELRPDIIAKDKASKHPLKHGRFYTARVTKVSETGLITIYVDELQSYFGPLIQLNLTDATKCSIGDYVKCTFSDEFFREVIVFGFTQKKSDVFAPVSSINSLSASVSVLNNAFYDQPILASLIFG